MYRTDRRSIDYRLLRLRSRLWLRTDTLKGLQEQDATVGEFLNTLSDTLIAYRMWAEVATRSRWGSRKRRNDCTRKHVCLLAWAFPPYVSGGVYRPTSLVKYGTDLGWTTGRVHEPYGPRWVIACGIPGATMRANRAIGRNLDNIIAECYK